MRLLKPVASSSPSSLLEFALRSLGKILVRCVYRVRSHRLENLPPGGFLLLPNHLSWVDALVLQIACPRPIRFVVFEEFYRMPLLHPVFRAVGAIPIAPKRAK